MDRTLFTPAMIETWQACRKAYEFAFLLPRNASGIKLSSVTKKLLLKGFAEINRGKIKSVADAQKFLGQNWSNIDIGIDAPEQVQSDSIRLFRFAYGALTQYVKRPYKPTSGEIVGANLKVRARIPHTKVYVEDVFDLLVWHPKEQVLEIVDYSVRPPRVLNPAWPSPSILVKQFLTEKIQTRFPFKKVRLTHGRILASGVQYHSADLDDSMYRLHWPELSKTIEEMKGATEFSPQTSQLCRGCEFASSCPAMKATELKTCEEKRDIIYRSAS